MIRLRSLPPAQARMMMHLDDGLGEDSTGIEVADMERAEILACVDLMMKGLVEARAGRGGATSFRLSILGWDVRKRGWV